MDKILVTYATMAGSTEEVARVVSEELAKNGLQVEVLPIVQVKDLSGYTGVVVGAPMIMGWHRQARRFLRQHRKQMQSIPLAVFILAMSLTQEEAMGVDGVSVVVDPGLPKPAQDPARLSFRERYTRLGNYLKPILKSAHPVSIGVFGGRLEYGRLKWWAVLFAMLIIQAPAGDRRNWEAMRDWASGLTAAFNLAQERTDGD
jgi:menaquinone-dependent protoporphyrinogen oxidase